MGNGYFEGVAERIKSPEKRRATVQLDVRAPNPPPSQRARVGAQRRRGGIADQVRNQDRLSRGTRGGAQIPSVTAPIPAPSPSLIVRRPRSTARNTSNERDQGTAAAHRPRRSANEEVAPPPPPSRRQSAAPTATTEPARRGRPGGRQANRPRSMHRQGSQVVVRPASRALGVTAALMSNPAPRQAQSSVSGPANITASAPPSSSRRQSVAATNESTRGAQTRPRSTDRSENRHLQERQVPVRPVNLTRRMATLMSNPGQGLNPVVRNQLSVRAPVAAAAPDPNQALAPTPPPMPDPVPVLRAIRDCLRAHDRRRAAVPDEDDGTASAGAAAPPLALAQPAPLFQGSVPAPPLILDPMFSRMNLGDFFRLYGNGGIGVPGQVDGRAPALPVAQIPALAAGPGPPTPPDVPSHRQGQAGAVTPAPAAASPPPLRQTPMPVIVPPTAPVSDGIGITERSENYGRRENQLRVTFQLDARAPVLGAAAVPVAVPPPPLPRPRLEPTIVRITERSESRRRRSSQPPVPRPSPSLARSSSRSARSLSREPRNSPRTPGQSFRAPRSTTNSERHTSRASRSSTHAPRSSSRSQNVSSRPPRSSSNSRRLSSRATSRSSSSAPRSSPRVPGRLGRCPTNVDDFMKGLHNLRGAAFNTAPEGFTRKFAQGEHLLNNQDVKVNIWKNGMDFMRNVKDFDEIHLIRSKRGLNMKVPEDLDFDTIENYISTTQQYPIINSRTQGSENMTIHELLAEFKKPHRPKIWNMLSMEFDQAKQKLHKKFKVPEFVRQNSIIKKLKRALKEQLKGINEELKNEPSGAEKIQLQAEKTRLNQQLFNMPKYQKFLLLSMADSFTDVHVDFSATSVYYHVKKGKKIFYVAKPTPENLQIYKDFEMKRNTGEKWIGEVLSKEWRRLEIGEGDTAMIPSGYIHFVYTPEDSIVIGGNYLMEKYMKQQFELTKLEEVCVAEGRSINYSNMMQGFRNVMWSYVENCLIPEMREAPGAAELKAMARIFMEELDPGQLYPRDWYTVQQKKKMLAKLREMQPGGARLAATQRKRRSQGASGAVSKKAK